MSRRVRSEFGTLGERVAGTPRPASTTEAKHCIVDETWPGLAWAWARPDAGQWFAWVAYVDDDGLHVTTLPASRLRKA